MRIEKIAAGTCDGTNTKARCEQPLASPCICTFAGEYIEPFSKPPSTKHTQLDVYIIHRGPDTKEAIARPLAKLLQRHGFKVFFDHSHENHSMPLGAINSECMQQALYSCRHAIVILSKNFDRSRWCIKEINTILLRELEDRHIVIPCYYDIDHGSHPYELLSSRNGLVRTTESANEFCQLIADSYLELRNSSTGKRQTLFGIFRKKHCIGIVVLFVIVCAVIGIMVVVAASVRQDNKRPVSVRNQPITQSPSFVTMPTVSPIQLRTSLPVVSPPTTKPNVYTVFVVELWAGTACTDGFFQVACISANNLAEPVLLCESAELSNDLTKLPSKLPLHMALCSTPMSSCYVEGVGYTGKNCPVGTDGYTRIPLRGNWTVGCRSGMGLALLAATQNCTVGESSFGHGSIDSIFGISPSRDSLPYKNRTYESTGSNTYFHATFSDDPSFDERYKLEENGCINPSQPLTLNHIRPALCETSA